MEEPEPAPEHPIAQLVALASLALAEREERPQHGPSSRDERHRPNGQLAQTLRPTASLRKSQQADAGEQVESVRQQRAREAVGGRRVARRRAVSRAQRVAGGCQPRNRARLVAASNEERDEPPDGEGADECGDLDRDERGLLRSGACGQRDRRLLRVRREHHRQPHDRLAEQSQKPVPALCGSPR